jgi:hypothetical protein
VKRPTIWPATDALRAAFRRPGRGLKSCRWQKDGQGVASYFSSGYKRDHEEYGHHDF